MAYQGLTNEQLWNLQTLYTDGKFRSPEEAQAAYTPMPTGWDPTQFLNETVERPGSGQGAALMAEYEAQYGINPLSWRPTTNTPGSTPTTQPPLVNQIPFTPTDTSGILSRFNSGSGGGGEGSYGPTTYQSGGEVPQVTDNGYLNQFDPSTELVEDRLTNLLSEDSVYMQRAETKALQDMNSRGLLNTSMAIGAAYAAAIDASLPIATEDARAINATRTQMRALLHDDLQNRMKLATEILITDKDNQARIAVANIGAKSAYDVASLQSRTAITTTAMDVASRENIAQLNANVTLADQANQRAMNDAKIAAGLEQTRIDAATKLTLGEMDMDTKMANTFANMVNNAYHDYNSGMNTMMQLPGMDTDTQNAWQQSLASSLANALGMAEDLTGIPAPDVTIRPPSSPPSGGSETAPPVVAGSPLVVAALPQTTGGNPTYDPWNEG